MAVSKFIGAIHPPKGNSGGRYKVLKNTINYVLNPKKTCDGKYTAGIGCFTESALKEMIKTKEFYGKTSDNKHERLGYHFLISWPPEENIDSETALEIAKEFLEDWLHGEYECILGVHEDKGHKHVHIVFNSVNSVTGKKFVYKDDDWVNIIQPKLDAVCQRHGLNTLSEDTGISLEEYAKQIKEKRMKKRYGKKYKSPHTRSSNNKYYNENEESYSKSDYIREILDEFILESNSMDQFYQKIREYGFELKIGNSEKYGEYFAVRGQGMPRFRRNYALGKDYVVDAIKRRIEAKMKPLPEYPEQKNTRYIIHYTYWRRIKIQNPFIRKYYYRLYNTGIRYAYKHVNYYEVKDALKNIKKLNEQIDMIEKYNITDEKAAQSVIDSLQDEMEKINEKRKQFNYKKKPYQQLLKVYADMQKLETNYQMYLQGDMTFEDDYKKYLECKKVFDKYGFTKDELKKFKDDLKRESKDISKEKKEQKQKIDLLNELIKDISDREDYEYEIPEPIKEKTKSR